MTVVTLEEAVSSAFADGQTIYFGGFTHLVPFAAGHELIRQGYSNLTVCRPNPDMVFDQLIASGAVSKLVFSYFPFRCFRRAVESGVPNEIELEEYTHFGTISRIAAGAFNLPFLPLRSFMGSDLPAHNDRIKSVTDPYGGEEIPVVPALEPDVGVIHVPRADPTGNAQVWGILGELRHLAFAADTLIVTAEEVVDESLVRSDPNRNVPGAQVDFVVEEPFGAHPSYVQGYYDRDQQTYDDWNQLSSSHEVVQDWLDEWVYGVDDRTEYLEKLGTAYLQNLRAKSNYAAPVNMGDYA